MSQNTTSGGAMPEDSLWLQASFHVPDPFGGREADLEVERRLHAPNTTPQSSSGAQSQNVSSVPLSQPAAPTLTQPRSTNTTPALASFSQPLPRPQSRVAAMRASLSMDRPAGNVPSSPVAASSTSGGGGFLTSVRTIGDAAAHVATISDESLRSQLREAQEEVAMLRSIVNTERQTADSWKARANEAARSRDEAEVRERAALVKLDANMTRHREEVDAMAQKADELEREWQMKVDIAIGKATAAAKAQFETKLAGTKTELSETQEQLRQAERRCNDLSMQLAMAQDDIRRLQSDLELAQSDAQAATTRGRQQVEAADAQRRSELAALSEEHAKLLQKQQADFQTDLKRSTDDAEDRIKSLRQRQMAVVESMQHEAKLLRDELNSLQEALDAKSVEMETAVATATATLKQRLEEEKARALNSLEEDHRVATQKMIDDHLGEMSQLRARVSESNKLEDRVRRLTTELADERSATQSAMKETARVSSQMQDLQRQLTQKTTAVAELRKQVDTLNAAREEMETFHDAELTAERERGNARANELLAQMAQSKADNDEAENEWTELTEELKRSKDHVESELAAHRAAWAKERVNLMSAEAESRAQTAQAIQQVEAVSSQCRKLQSRIDTLEMDAASANGERKSYSHATEALKQRLVAAQQKIVDLEIEVSAMKANAATVAAEHAAALKSAFASGAATAAPVAPVMAARTFATASPAPMPVTADAAPPTTTTAPSPVVGRKRRVASSEPPVAPPPLVVPQQVPAAAETAVAVTTSAPSRGRGGSRKTARDDSTHVEPVLPPTGRIPLGDRNAPVDAKTANRPPLAPPAQPSCPPASQQQQNRVFALSGFDDNKELVARIQSMPNASVAHSRSNAPVAPEVTHLISAGALTIKVLTAVARGCWLLPPTYVEESVAAGRWLDEHDYGFQHTVPPLKGKRVAMTDAFKATRHFAAAALVAKDAGADVNPMSIEASEAAALARSHQLDIFLCAPAELSTAHTMLGDRCKGYTWDTMVKFLYPTAVSSVSASAVPH